MLLRHHVDEELSEKKNIGVGGELVFSAEMRRLCRLVSSWGIFRRRRSCVSGR